MRKLLRHFGLAKREQRVVLGIMILLVGLTLAAHSRKPRKESAPFRPAPISATPTAIGPDHVGEND
jgi:hypothetical protein